MGDAASSGHPRKRTDEEVEAAINRTVNTRPKNATRWSACAMTEAGGLNQDAIVRIRRASGLKPRLQEHVTLSIEPFFVKTSATWSRRIVSRRSPLRSCRVCCRP